MAATTEQQHVENLLRAQDEASLAELARQATGRPTLDPGAWTWRRISGDGTPPTIGVYRLAGTGSDQGEAVPWSIVLKVIRRPASNPANSSADTGAADPTARAYWQREILAYQSGFLAELPGGLSAPRLLDVSERPGRMVWLWLQDLDDDEDTAWPLGRYGLAARHFGTFNGVYLTQRPLPGYPWLRPRVQASELPAADMWPDIRLLRDEHTWRDRRLGGAFSAAMVERLLAQWEHRRALFEAFLRLPPTLCHWDAHRGNLFARRGPHGELVTAAIDWASIGAGPVGAELCNLVLGSIIVKAIPAAEGQALDATVFPSYLDGLRAAGWRGDARLARFGFTASAGLAAAPTLHGFLVSVLERGGRDGPEDTFPAPTAVQLAQWSGYTAFSLDLGDEALALLPVI